jgi:hypothetical protein
MFPRFHAFRSQSLLLSILVLLTLAAIALAGCGQPASVPSIPNVTIIAKDYTFDIPKGIHAGLINVTLVNQGGEPHQAQFMRLNQGVTLDQFFAALKDGPEAALPLATSAGGPNAVMPGQRQEVTLNLLAGQYVAICFVTSPDGHSHAEKGMVTPFTVEKAASGSQPADPQADGVVTLKDFSISMSDALTAGKHTLKVTNQGPQSHEFSLIHLAPGKTAQDVMTFFMQPAGPPPFTDAGGMGALAPHTSGWVEVDLAAGDYMALCFVPDPQTGKAHVMLGMLTSFTVN